MSFYQFLQLLETNSISEYVCLGIQFIITIHTIINLQANKSEFPVKQLSPLLSLSALICFILLNIISFIAKIIEQQNNYYNPNYSEQSCGQCRLYDHTQMMILAFLYNGLRQLPLIIFIIKTYRVCLCYYKSYDKPLHPITIYIFRSQKILLAISIFVTIVYSIIGFFVFDSGNQHNGMLVWEFFCPKQSSVYDWVVILIRFLCMAYVYIISIYTNRELDFKKFLLLIFLLTNLEVILRLSLVMQGITQTTYHEFYYHSFLLNTFGTLIVFYYSTIKQQRNRSLGRPILQYFNGFLQTTLGFSVLVMYVEYLDKTGKPQENSDNTYSQIFEAYIKIDEMNMFESEGNFKIQDCTQQILNILVRIDILSKLSNRELLINKCKNKDIAIRDLREADTILLNFCEQNIFNSWRQTSSSKFLEKQFQDNGVIHNRMNALNIHL